MSVSGGGRGRLDAVLHGLIRAAAEEAAAQESQEGEDDNYFEDLYLMITRALARPSARRSFPNCWRRSPRPRRPAARAVFLGGWTMALGDLEAIAPGGAPAIADALRIPSK